MRETLTREMPETGEWLTMDEIEKRYDGEWVLIINPEADEHLNVIAGQVVAHNKSRQAIVDSALWMQPGSAALFYIGELAPDMVYML